MIVQKPAELEPAMKSALRNHIMRKRQQLKQELEQDAIEKRLKREQEAKRKQDAMTLDQLKEQLSHLEKTLDNLKSEKHSLFVQLKQNMRVLDEDDTRRKQKEGEINNTRQQQNQPPQQINDSHNHTPAGMLGQPQANQAHLNQTSVPLTNPSPTQPSQPLTPFVSQTNAQIQPSHLQPKSTNLQPISASHRPSHPTLLPSSSPNHSSHLPAANHTQSFINNNGHLAHAENIPPHQAKDKCQETHNNNNNNNNQTHLFQNQLLSSHGQQHHQQPSQQQPPPLSVSQQQQAPPTLPPVSQQQQPPSLPPVSQQQQQQQQHQQQPPTRPSSNHHDLDNAPGLNLQSNHAQSNHLPRPGSILNPAAFSQLMNAHSLQRQPYLSHLPPTCRSANPFAPMASVPSLSGHGQPPSSLMAGHGVPTSLTHLSQNGSMVRPSPPPQIPPGQMGGGSQKLPLGLPITSAGPSAIDFNAPASSTAHQLQQQALNNAAAALGIQYGSPYFNSSSPLSHSLATQQALEHHAVLNAVAAAAASNQLSNSSTNSSGTLNSVVNNLSSSSSRNNQPMAPLKRPISATNMANDTLSPNKKIHSQSMSQNPPQQLPVSLASPYLGYGNLPPGLGTSAGGSSLTPNLFSAQNLIRTPPPPSSMSSLFNSAAFSHLFNAHNFPRQPPYLGHPSLQSSRAPSPYGLLGAYSPLNHHGPPSLMTGHGIPTSLSHVPQGSPLIRPSPPPPNQMSNNPNQMNVGPPKIPLGLPISSAGQPSQLDFNPHLVSASAHQMQQQALNNSAAAGLAALGFPYGSPYFNSNSPLGSAMATQQALEQHALQVAAASAAASSQQNMKNRVAPYP